MGTNNLSQKTAGVDEIRAADVNQYFTALAQVLVGRNSSGVPTDIAGSLGSSSIRWNQAFINAIFLGLTASGLSIEEDSGDIIFKVGSTEVNNISATGIGGLFQAAQIQAAAMQAGVIGFNREVFTSNGTFTTQSDVSRAYVQLIGGGGGGGGGSGTGTSGPAGGNGGNSGDYFEGIIELTPSTGYAVTIGSGGTAGSGNTVSSDNATAGGNGGTTSFGSIISVSGGAGGTIKGNSITEPNFGRYVFATKGGLGDTTTVSTGEDGEDTPFFSGGTGGNGGAGYDGGGGGASRFGSGGDGGQGAFGSGTVGGSAAANSGAGGGGGGGNGQTGGTSFAGGAGGSGLCVVYYLPES